MKRIFILLCLAAVVFASQTQAQTFLKDRQLKFTFNEAGTHYVQLTMVGQVWVRYNENNPGSTIFGGAQAHTFDIGVRRWRTSLFSQVTDRVFIFTQFGMNNFSSSSKQFSGFFIHDAYAEYAIHKKGLFIGAGLSGWNGLSRYASPGVGSIMTMDAPLYQQVTNGVNDQFLRKLSVHFKGKINKLDYRLAVTKPMAVQNAVNAIKELSAVSEFSTRPTTVQAQGYFMWQFFDQESNLTPYTTGTYLGKKKVLNVGAGFIIQSQAMWHLRANGDTVLTSMKLFAADVFYDAPLNKEKRNAITAYASYHYMDLGPNYMRNSGVMNPANGTDATGSMNGAGNAFPMVGTGSTIYMQLGYKFRDDLIPKNGTIQPFVATQIGLFQALDQPMVMVEGGFNVFITGSHNSKLSLNYQNRPVFSTSASGKALESDRKSMAVIQYQVSF
jgi:hypothetical protein